MIALVTVIWCCLKQPTLFQKKHKSYFKGNINTCNILTVCSFFACQIKITLRLSGIGGEYNINSSDFLLFNDFQDKV